MKGVTFYPPGTLAEADAVFIYARHRGRWLLSLHGKRAWETPGGHVEPGEAPLQAARRELYEETGATDFTIEPLWDLIFWHEGGEGRARSYLAEVESLGPLPGGSEMVRVALFDELPRDFTWDRDEIASYMVCALNGTIPASWRGESYADGKLAETTDT